MPIDRYAPVSASKKPVTPITALSLSRATDEAGLLHSGPRPQAHSARPARERPRVHLEPHRERGPRPTPGPPARLGAGDRPVQAKPPPQKSS